MLDHAPSLALEVCLWTLDVLRVAWALDVVVDGALLLEHCCWNVVAVTRSSLRSLSFVVLWRVLCWRVEY